MKTVPHGQNACRVRSATLLLADGTRVVGRGMGPDGLTTGELVFTTAMTGYQEALTDPSYRGQILLFTYPLIGNYGIAERYAQSREIHARAAIVSTLSTPSTGRGALDGLLTSGEIPMMHGIDTRMLAQHVRRQGAMSAVLALHAREQPPSDAELARALAESAYDRRDFISETTVQRPEVYGPSGGRQIALLDCGNKRGVVEQLVRRDVQVVCLPARTSAEDILALHPDGVIISNGPGNPEGAGEIVSTVRAIVGQIPVFGICLGHQLLALAAGGHTYKLKFGHRGANHPVQDVVTGRAFITTQNHGYAVDPDSLPGELYVSHRNVNDGTVEGLAHRYLPVRSVQFHPEGAPGPTDSSVVLDAWMEKIA